MARITKDTMKSTVRDNHNKLGFYTISDIERHHTGHWFSKDTMRFFKSRIVNEFYCGKNNIYFVSSECGPNNIRLFSVRQYNPSNRGTIATIGEFNTMTKSQALALALNLAYKETKGE